MRPTRPRRPLSITLSACLAVICWAGPEALFAGETCLAPEMFGWHLQGGPQPVRYLPDDPTCNKYLELDGNLRCGGWLGMLITHRPLAAEHHLVIDVSQLAFGAGEELVFWQSLRQGESEPTIQLKVTSGAAPELLVELHSDDRSASAATALSPSGEHQLMIRWTAPMQIGSGTFEVWIDGLQPIAEDGLTFDEKLPDLIQVGALNCPPGGSGLFIFDPVSTSFEHF